MCDTCCVANQHCDAPANLDPPRQPRSKCFSCGERVCTQPGCSIVTTYRSYGRQRICASCLEQRQDDTPTLKRAWRRLLMQIVLEAGYSKEAAEKQADEWMNGGGNII
jgi:hypothetical protein